MGHRNLLRNLICLRRQDCDCPLKRNILIIGEKRECLRKHGLNAENRSLGFIEVAHEW